MSGIAGVVRLDGRPVDEATLARMSAALRHRGPDQDATWSSGCVGLVHRRLWVIDRAGSRQPMVSADGRHVLVLDGEILNYRLLRRETAYPYRTDGDSEVVLAEHAVNGERAPLRLSGQFAYALYDTAESLLSLVRDRAGVLPLYWYQDPSQVIFASEVAALLTAVPARPELDPSALSAYLVNRFVPSPGTLLSGIRKLRPGHVLTVDRLGATTEVPYWQGRSVPDDLPMSPDDAVDRLDGLLDDAVGSALVADVPVGAYLSGGVDSSLLVSKIGQQGGHEGLHTYCADFGDVSEERSDHAATVSAAFETRHHRVSVGPDDFLESWQQLSVRRGAPLSEPTDVALYRLASAAKDHVSVVVSGEGSDELFGSPPMTRTGGVRLRGFADPTFEERVHDWFARSGGSGGSGSPGAVATMTAPAQHAAALSTHRRMLLEDLAGWIPDNLLERADRMSMAASVELRMPFLDRDVVDFALRVPSALLARGGDRKWLLKEVARRYLPKEIVDRSKVGHRVPLDAWFRGGLRDLAWDLVSSASSVTSGYLDTKAVTRLFTDHDRTRRDESVRIWTVASLEVWYAGLLAGVPESSR